MCHENKIQIHIFFLFVIHSRLPFFFTVRRFKFYIYCIDYFKAVQDEKSALLATIATF